MEVCRTSGFDNSLLTIGVIYTNGDDDYGWPKDGYKYASPVKSFKPYAWGLYDMSGNVMEWCQDTMHGHCKGAPSDGSAWETPDKDNNQEINKQSLQFMYLYSSTPSRSVYYCLGVDFDS